MAAEQDGKRAGRIVYFCIPAFGHTNPTIEVVRELIRRGNAVWYYTFEPFRQKIEAIGAKFIPCDAFLPPVDEKALDKKVGKDFAALIEMAADVAMNAEKTVLPALEAFQPDIVVTDSVCIWGKLFAKKLKVPMVCSTTTFAFNRYSAALQKPTFTDILRTITGMPRINRKIKALRAHGFPVENYLSLIQNDNDTETIVYTSKAFQPFADTFSDRYCFCGPSLPGDGTRPEKGARPLVYVSLGTVMNRNALFYRNAIEALGGGEWDVIMAVGDKTDIAALGPIPANITVSPSVNQLDVLKRASAFITHCGMNSVSESIYYGVPMALFPQQAEERAVAGRAAELKAGIIVDDDKPETLRTAVLRLLTDPSFAQNAARIGETFRQAGGASAAADKVEAVMRAGAKG